MMFSALCLAAAIPFSTGIKETSGLAVRIDPAGQKEWVAIGDSSFDVGIGKYDGKTLRFTAVSVAKLFSRKVSQWEAVAADGEGNLCFLQENPGAIECVNRELTKSRGRVALKFPPSDPNSRGEGMVLLKNGHVLVLKEKQVPLLIEFGPRGHKAAGYSPGDAVKGEFSLGAAKEFVPLKTWEFGETSSEIAEDLSELTVGPEGRLYVLSDKSQLIAGLERHLPPDSLRFRIDDWMDVAVEKPEGVVYGWGVREDGWLVASDEPTGRNNIFPISK